MIILRTACYVLLFTQTCKLNEIIDNKLLKKVEN